MSWLTYRHEAMATFFEIAIADHPDAEARPAAAAAFREVDRLERELSRFVETSDIARASRLRSGESIVLGDDALECLLIATDVALATNGTFDVAYASTRAPDADPIALPYALDLATHTLTSRANTLKLDLGAVGKGYGLDRAAAVLTEWSITIACLVAGGSTVLALEPPSGSSGWPIGIGDPPQVRNVPLAHAALSASGTAVKGAHLIDPRTGRAATRAARAWALAPNAAQSDALSTAFFVLTDNEVAGFCETHPHIGAALAAHDHSMVSYGALNRL